MSFQYSTDTDMDPDQEPGIAGIVRGNYWGDFSNNRVARGRQGGQVFIETILEQQSRTDTPPGLLARALAHEIGHQMGLGHIGIGGHDEQNPNLMNEKAHLVTNEQARFDPQHLHLLRKRVATPGQLDNE